eukprot:TRINITY_DN2431_c0_g3_i1.p1 TRINITY_DN2431_c0_g3~~TRINITY_DN2431_c0_g3_i1.p1  ORF type:complete len:894 (-),score=255.54 TRINITY_DN2431_c0_g3_i1:1338-3953(-)
MSSEDLILSPRASGRPLSDFWESTETIELLDRSVKPWLARHAKKYLGSGEALSGRSISALVVGALDFMEEVFGGEGLPERKEAPYLRLPMRFFLDFRQGGSLCHLLEAMYKAKANAGWRKFDFGSSGRKETSLGILRKIEDVLIREGFFRVPILYIGKTLSEDDKDIVEKHARQKSFKIADEESEATHVIYPRIQPDPSMFCRPILKRGDKYLIHFSGAPESRDDMGHLYSPEDIEPLEISLKRDSTYHVTLDWLSETGKYREYMSEEDFKVDPRADNNKFLPHSLSLSIEEATRLEGKPRKKAKRKSSGSNSSSNSGKGSIPKPSKRARGEELEDDVEEETLEKEEGESTAEEPSLIAEDADENESIADKADEELTRGEEEEDKEDDNAELEDPEDEDSNSLLFNRDLKDTEESEDNVTEQTHHIIIPSYSSWFDYNSIHSIEKRSLPEFFNLVNRSKSPEIYLSHRNFMIDTYRLNPTEYLTSTACRRNLAGDVCVILRVHAFLEQWGLINYQVELDPGRFQLPPQTSHSHILAEAVKSQGIQEEKSGEVVDKKDLALRTDLYASSSSSKKNRSWGDQETLLLLEALEMHKDDWNKVVTHVGSRSHEECILHFLRLPIEDPYVKSSSTLGPLAFQPLPFSAPGNPVCSTLAFLASLVDPRVSQAGCQGAMEEFSRIKDEVPNVILKGHLKGVEAAKERGAASPERESLERSGIAGTEVLPQPNDEEEELRTKESSSPGDKEDENVEDEEDSEKSEDPSPLSSAAVKAKNLAAQEERKIKSLVALLVDTQMKKLEIKLRHFEELELIMDKEREALEGQRQLLIQERQQFHLEQLKEAESRAASVEHTPDELPSLSSPTTTEEPVSSSAET